MIPKKSDGVLVFLFFLLVAALTVWGCASVTGGATVEEVSVDVALIEDDPLRQRALEPGVSASVCEYTGAPRVFRGRGQRNHRRYEVLGEP